MRSITILLVTILFMSAAKADMNKWNKDQWEYWSGVKNEIENRQDLCFPWRLEDPQSQCRQEEKRTKKNLRKNIRNEQAYYCKTWNYRCKDAIL